MTLRDSRRLYESLRYSWGGHDDPGTASNPEASPRAFLPIEGEGGESVQKVTSDANGHLVRMLQPTLASGPTAQISMVSHNREGGSDIALKRKRGRRPRDLKLNR